MTDTHPPPPLPDDGDTGLPPEGGTGPSRPPGRRLRLPGTILILAIAGTALALGWWLGLEMERRNQAGGMSRISSRNSLLEEENSRLLLDTRRARTTAAEAAGETTNLRAELASLRERIAGLEQRLADQQRAASDLEKSYRKGWDATKEELEATRETFRRYRETHRNSVREEARGEKLGDFPYRNHVFEDAVIERITPAGIEIRHASGAARLLFPLLPPDLRQRFAYEPGEAAEQLAAERRRWIETRMIADNARLEEEREKTELGRRIATRQAENEVRELLERLRAAERSLTFCEDKLTSPGRRSPRDYERKIRQLKNDIVHYESELERFGIYR